MKTYQKLNFNLPFSFQIYPVVSRRRQIVKFLPATGKFSRGVANSSVFSRTRWNLRAAPPIRQFSPRTWGIPRSRRITAVSLSCRTPLRPDQMLGDRHARDQLLAQLVVDEVVARYPAHLQPLRVLLLVNDAQLDLDAAVVLQRQLVGYLLRFRLDDAELGRHLVRYRLPEHLEDVGRAELRTDVGQFDLKRARALLVEVGVGEGEGTGVGVVLVRLADEEVRGVGFGRREAQVQVLEYLEVRVEQL